MAIAQVQNKSNQGTTAATSIATSFTSTPAANNLIVVAVSAYNTALLSTAVADNHGNTYTQIAGEVTDGSAASHVNVYSAIAATVAAPFTVTATVGAATQISMILAEYSGAVTASPLDQHAGATATSAAASSGVTGTRVQASELLFGAESDNNTSDTTATAGTGFTFVGTQITDGVAGQTLLAEDQIVAAAGTDAATFTIPSAMWVCEIGTFKASGTVADTYPGWLRPPVRYQEWES